MKHSKKKKRPRPPISKSKQSAGCQNPTAAQIDDQSSDLNGLAEGIASFSIEENIGNLTEAASRSSANRDDDGVESFASLTETASSSSGSSGLSNCDGYNGRIGGKVSKGSRGIKVIATTGMVSSVLGKDYMPTSNRRWGFANRKGGGDGGVSHEDAEQFLCSMLSDDCDLGMDLVKDVLCQCAYDVEKALDILLELTAPLSALPKTVQHHNLDTKSKDTTTLLESSDSLTNMTSGLASSSESDHLGNVPYMDCNDRSYFDVLATDETHPQTGPKNAYELTQEVLESLFHMPKSSKHEPNSMNWRNVVKKLESFGQMLDDPSTDTGEKQNGLAKGEDYQSYRISASQHWDSMRSYYHKAATAYASGKREYAAYLSDQGRICNEKARQADKRASQDIFGSRNKDIENMITIDLHGQHVKQGMKLLKLHLLFGAYVRSVRLFRVITGCGSHGLGMSKLKQSVANLLETENIEWKEENRGTLLIKLNGQREFSFLDSGSDSD